MARRERWVNNAFIIQADGELHRVAISLNDVEAQKRIPRESVGEPPNAVELDDGTLWVDAGAVDRGLSRNPIASTLAGSDVLGRVVFTGRDSLGKIADLGGRPFGAYGRAARSRCPATRDGAIPGLARYRPVAPATFPK